MKKYILILIVSIISSCSSPQDLTETNLKKCVQDFLSTQKACFTLSLEFPCTLAIDSRRYKRNELVLNELIRLGLLDSKDTETNKKNPFDDGWSNKKYLAKEYTLTEKGKELAFKKKRNVFSVMGETSFDYGGYSVVDVINFTTPADFKGRKATKVTYTYKAENIAEWVNSSEVLKKSQGAITKDIKSQKEPLKGEILLVQTQNGWVSEI